MLSAGALLFLVLPWAWLAPQVGLPSADAAVSPPGPGLILPREDDLRRSGSDEVELERVATRLGPARLLRLAASAAPLPRRLAALRGLMLSGQEHPDLAAQALLPLAELIARLSEPRLLAAAAQAAQRLSWSLGRAPLPGDEPLSDELPRAAALLLRLAADTTLDPALRADLIEAVAELPPLRSPARTATLAALAQGDAGPVQIQRAALSALSRRLALEPAAPSALAQPGSSGSSPGALTPAAALTALSGAEDLELSIPASAALCEVPGPIPELLAARVRLQAGSPGPAKEARPVQALRRQLIPCLRRLGTASDQRLISVLSRGGSGKARKGP